MKLIRLAAVMLVVAACGGDVAPTVSDPGTTLVGTSVVTTLVGTSVVTTEPPTGTTVVVTTTAPAALPPHTYEALAPLLDPLVAPLGFRVTRAALVSLQTYETDPAGTHLAVYVEPLVEPDIEAVAAATVPLAAVFLPEVFAQWPGLLSFDICQERYAASTAGSPPPPETVLNVTREVALGIDWDTVTLAELLAQLSADFTLYASTEVQQSTTWSTAAGA